MGIAAKATPGMPAAAAQAVNDPQCKRSLRHKFGLARHAADYDHGSDGGQRQFGRASISVSTRTDRKTAVDGAVRRRF